VELVIYLLDTDMLIFLARGQKLSAKPDQRKRAKQLEGRCAAAQAAGHQLGLSAASISELEYGAQLSGQYKTEILAVRKLLTPFELYDYDAIYCPARYGFVRRELEVKGLVIGAMDLLIAAHALALDATLVSNNVAHFSRVPGLKVENWLSKYVRS
jgi:tRNA(fMet)-specific endonuclease VapC